MKTETINAPIRREIPRYPAAADRRYYLQKLLDGVLAVAMGVGAFVALAFLMLL
ncbi:MAG: hypothetical protein IJV82_03305 [Oscillospiraceae bacterium]|nr:hypothetical protein [Oscillospiraceae bacterium]